MERRTFLQRSALIAGAVGVPGLLAACGQGEGEGNPGATATPAVFEGQPELNPVVATFEVLTGAPRSVLFGLRTLDNVEVPESDVTVYLRDETGRQILGGPYDTEYVVAPGTQIGLYRVELTFDTPGKPQLVAVEGDRYGATNITVATPETSQAPAPGTKATAVPTPTPDKPLGYTKICTQDPPCDMHEMSLDTALKDKRPVMLIFATPEFCQTVVCGPAVATVDDVRNSGDWGDTAWIHVEIYSKTAGATPTLGPPVKQWNLPSEPWLFSVGRNGQIVDRLDGPMVTSDIERMATGLTA